MPSNTKTKSHGFVQGVGIAAEIGRTYESVGTDISCGTSTAYTDPIDIRESSTASLYFSATLNSATYVDIGLEMAGTISGTYYRQAILDTSSSDTSHTLRAPLARVAADGNYRWTVPIAGNYMKVSYITDNATAILDTLDITLSAQSTAWQTKPYTSGDKCVYSWYHNLAGTSNTFIRGASGIASGGHTILRGGTITGISIFANIPPSGDDCWFVVYKNAAATTVSGVLMDESGIGYSAANTASVSAGDYLKVKIENTTSTLHDDIIVDVEVEY